MTRLDGGNRLKTKDKIKQLSEFVRNCPKIKNVMPKIQNKEIALNALLNSTSITDAAQKSQLSEKTLRRYLADAQFQKEFRLARRVIFEQNIFRLNALHAGAVDTLERNLHCENPSVEVRAAQIVIEANRKDFETFDILERLEQLEINNANKNES